MNGVTQGMDCYPTVVRVVGGNDGSQVRYPIAGIAALVRDHAHWSSTVAKDVKHVDLV